MINLLSCILSGFGAIAFPICWLINQQEDRRFFSTAPKSNRDSYIEHKKQEREMNHLYFGDCLDVLKGLKRNQPEPFIDLTYIDPPSNSKRKYNVLFEGMDMKDANAQKQAFAVGKYFLPTL